MPFIYKPQAAAAKLPAVDDTGKIFAEDSVSSSDTGAAYPISAGFFRLEKGAPCVYKYEYDDTKYFTEGECIIEDETGQKVTARPGDLFLFSKGSTVTFTTDSYCVAFFCGQRAKL